MIRATDLDPPYSEAPIARVLVKLAIHCRALLTTDVI